MKSYKVRIFVGFLIFSLELNLVVLERYDVIRKLKYKTMHYFDTVTAQSLSAHHSQENNKPIFFI